MSYSYKFEDLIPEFRHHLDYLGLELIEMSQGFREDHFNYELYLLMKQSCHPRKLDKPHDLLKDVLEPLFHSIKNSKYIKDVRADYEKRIAELENEVQTLQKTNENLSEGLTNGAEFLDQMESEDEQK